MSQEFVIVEWKSGQQFGRATKPVHASRQDARQALAKHFEYDYHNRDGAKAELKAFCRSQGRMPSRLDSYNYDGKFYAIAPAIEGAYITPFAPRQLRENRTSDDLLL